MDLGVYNVSYIVGLFGEPNKAVYAANMERNIDTSGVLMMDYSGFKAVSLAAKDSQPLPAASFRAQRATFCKNPPRTTAAA